MGLGFLHIIVFLIIICIYFWDIGRKNPTEEVFQKLSGHDDISVLITKIEQAAVNQTESDFLFLARCLEHPELEVNSFCSQTLSQLNHPRALEILLNRIKSLDEEIAFDYQSDKQSESQVTSLPFAYTMETSPVKPENRADELRFLLHPNLCENDFSRLQAHTTYPILSLDNEELWHILLSMTLDTHESSATRFYALHSLKSFPKVPPEAVLSENLFSRDILLKQGAIELIGHFRLKQYISRLEIELNSLNPSVVLDSIYALIELNAKESLSRIVLISEHQNKLIRDAARYALNKLQRF